MTENLSAPHSMQFRHVLGAAGEYGIFIAAGGTAGYGIAQITSSYVMPKTVAGLQSIDQRIDSAQETIKKEQTNGQLAGAGSFLAPAHDQEVSNKTVAEVKVQLNQLEVRREPLATQLHCFEATCATVGIIAALCVQKTTDWKNNRRAAQAHSSTQNQ